jgi:hypothetical protein
MITCTIGTGIKEKWQKVEIRICLFKKGKKIVPWVRPFEDF